MSSNAYISEMGKINTINENWEVISSNGFNDPLSDTDEIAPGSVCIVFVVEEGKVFYSFESSDDDFFSKYMSLTGDDILIEYVCPEPAGEIEFLSSKFELKYSDNGLYDLDEDDISFILDRAVYFGLIER